MKNLAIRNAVNNLIQFTSEFGKYKNEGIFKEVFDDCREKLILLLHPIAPHMTEEIWEMIGKKDFVSLASWPSYENELLTQESDYKWKLMNNTLDDISKIKIALKKESLKNL